MNLYPAIDLIGGKCVRLSQGDFERQSTYDVSALEVACDYARAGARYLHVVDLDGARLGRPQQTSLIGMLARESRLVVQSGGGLRTVEDARVMLESGISRVVIGSLAVKTPETARAIFELAGPERFTLATDVRLENDEPRLATHGWAVSETESFWDLLESYVALGLRHLLCTDIGRDGMLGGPNVALYRRIRARYPSLELQASGGVGSLADLRELRAAGVPGVIVGKALFERKFNLTEALAC